MSTVAERRAARRAPRDRAPILYVTGGKGGVGKTVLCVNLCAALARRGTRVLLVDLDLGAADADVLLRQGAERGLSDVLSGGVDLAACAVRTEHGFDFVPGTRGDRGWAVLADDARTQLVLALREAALDYDLVVLDGSPGIGPDVLGLAAAADSVLLVTTPDPSALTDAYGLLKALHERSEALDPEIPTPEVVVNRARDLAEAERTALRLRDVAQRFLARSPRWAGWMPESAAVAESCRRQRLLDSGHGCSAARSHLEALAARFVRPHRVACGGLR
ncbi:MAG: AAA family ATPase [Planctomycetes bacterium]|nr:AAA family ATPase [Planctomycetota bacterium]